MSTILKALKRLEQEKLERGEGRSEIALDIVKASPRSAKSTVPLKMIFFTAVVLVAALAIYLLPGRRPEVEYQASQVPIPKPLTEKLSAVAPPPITLPDPGQAETAKSTWIQPQVEKEIGNAVRDRRMMPKKETVQQQQATVELARRWTVSGIAWQKNEDDRLAVINGLPVMTGTVIDDATVTAIEEDRVLLSHQGEKVTIFLELPEGN